MLFLSALLITLISAAAFFVLIRHSYIKNIAECICVFVTVLGLCLAIFAICLYYARYGMHYYLLNRYFFLHEALLSFFSNLNVELLAIGNMLTVSRILFIGGVYCFCSFVTRMGLSLRKDWVLPACLIPLVMNLDFIYIPLISLFQQFSSSLYQTIRHFDILSRLCMMLPVFITLVRLFRYYHSTRNPSLRRSVLLFLVGVLLVCGEFILILDLTPGSAANVYTRSFMMDIMNTMLYSATNRPGIFFFSLAGILLITGSFALVIFSSVNVIRWQNYKRMGSLTINRNIPIINAQNLVPFLHSFKNQLISLRQFEELLTPDNFDQTYPLLRSVTDEMCRTIDNLYSNSRAIKLNIRRCNLCVCVRNAVTAVSAAKNVPIRFEDKGGTFFAMIDPDYIQHALENLLYNAVDACASRPEPVIRVQLFSPGRRSVLIRIQDNGEGISRENMKKIMEPFFSTKAQSHSWGMGLSHVNKIVNAHNGRVQFDSELGVGTTVSLWLPTGF